MQACHRTEQHPCWLLCRCDILAALCTGLCSLVVLVLQAEGYMYKGEGAHCHICYGCEIAVSIRHLSSLLVERLQEHVHQFKALPYARLRCLCLAAEPL